MATSASSSYKVVIPATDYAYSGSARNFNKLASQEFVYFMKEALGYTFTVIPDNGLTLDDTSRYVSLGETTLFEQTDIVIDKAELGDSGYVIKTVGGCIFICGGGTPGSLYGVYEFLNLVVGYEYFAAEEIYVDKVSEVKLPNLDVKTIPSFDSRYLSSSVYLNDANGFNRYRGLSPFIPSGMHNSTQLISREEYGTEHPEWFAKKPATSGFMGIGGTAQVDYNQLNFTADGLAEEVVKKLTAILVDTYNGGNYPKEQKYLFFGQMDNWNWDETDASEELENKYGSKSAALILFINEVADGVQAWIDVNQPGREVIICTFAYQQTIQPPTKNLQDMKLRDNVCIRFAALYEMDYFKSIEDEANAKVKEYLDGWNALGRTMTYFYSVYFCNYYVNVNNLDALPETYRYAYEAGVEAIYDQYLSNGKMSPCFNHYRAYLQANLMWNVDADVEELTDRFFAQYYRDAADIMRTYLNEINAEYDEHPDLKGNLNEGYFVDEDLWTKDTLLRWKGYMDNALATVAEYRTTDSALYEKLVDRITYESLSIRYLLIQLYGEEVYGDGLQAEKVAVYNLLVEYNMQPTNARQQLEGEAWGHTSLKEEWGIA